MHRCLWYRVLAAASVGCGGSSGSASAVWGTNDFRVLGRGAAQEIVARFQRDASIPVCLLSSQVGGLGLTLTAADRVVVADPAWNPATDNQAVDRWGRPPGRTSAAPGTGGSVCTGPRARMPLRCEIECSAHRSRQLAECPPIQPTADSRCFPLPLLRCMRNRSSAHGKGAFLKPINGFTTGTGLRVSVLRFGLQDVLRQRARCRRAYRIGQRRDVVVYRLITCGSVEEKIYRRQVFKGGLMRAATQTADPVRYFSYVVLPPTPRTPPGRLLHTEAPGWR